MANRERGEDDLTIGGVTYTLQLGTNAACQIEDAMSTPLRRMSYGDVLRAATKGEDVRAMRVMFWGMLRKFHRQVTLEQAGDLMDEAGDGVNFAEKLAAVALAAMPADDDLKALGIQAGKDRPPKAQRRRSGTGTRSISKPVTSA